MMQDQITFRIDSADKAKFTRNCRRAGVKPTNFLREVIHAFNEDRLRLVKPKTQKEIYHD